MVLSNYINLLLDLDANQIQYRLLKPIFNIIAWVYDMLMDIIDKTVFDDIESFTKSIYALVGVTMLFRLAISCLNYLINPETLSDKTTGGGKMAGRIVISLILILASSFVFDLLKEFQTDMINPSDGAIFRIININGNQEVIPMTRLNRKAKYPCAVTSGSQFANDAFMAFVEGDVEGYSTVSQVTFARSRCSANAEWGDTYNAAKKEMDSGFASDNITVQFLAGLVLGLAIIVFFIILCIDVIVRNLKLLVLEMIAPSAFIAYINPNDKIFKQWLTTYGKTYLELFIKLFAVSLLLKLLQFIGSANLHGFEKIFYILALLVFAKALPGFISKLFGIDGAGSFKESAGILKKGLGLGAGLVGAAAVGGISKGVAAYQGVRGRDTNNGKGRALAHALGSGLLGAGKGGLMGAGAGWSGKGISSVNAKSIKSAKNLGNNLASGGTFFGRTGSKIRSTFGVATKGEKETAQIEAASKAVKQKEDMNAVATKEQSKDHITKTRLGKNKLDKLQTAEVDLNTAKAAGVEKVALAEDYSNVDFDTLDTRIRKGETLYDTDGNEINMNNVGAFIENAKKDKKQGLMVSSKGLTDIDDAIARVTKSDGVNNASIESLKKRINGGETIIGADGTIIDNKAISVAEAEGKTEIAISRDGSGYGRDISLDDADKLINSGVDLYVGGAKIDSNQISKLREIGKADTIRANYHVVGDENATTSVAIDAISDNTNEFNTKVDIAKSSSQASIETTVVLGGHEINANISTLDAAATTEALKKRANSILVAKGNPEAMAEAKSLVDFVFNDHNGTYSEDMKDLEGYASYGPDGKIVWAGNDIESKATSVEKFMKIIDERNRKLQEYENDPERLKNLSNDEYNKKE